MTHRIATLTGCLLLATGLALADPPVLRQEPNTWVKRSPLKDAPPSPGMGYEASLTYDPVNRRVIRFGGHNQGGGGEQNGETWALDPVSMKWELKEPNRSPVGACCNQQNVFDTVGGRFLRFPAFSGQHGWHWFRENYLNNSSVWSYDLAANIWRDMRPAPALHPAPLRCAAWDSHHQVAVVFGGEGGGNATLVYDPYVNTWHRMKLATAPAPRSGGNMAYDAARRLHILFGTQFGDDPHTWAYDLAKDEWRDLKPAVQPPTDRNDTVLAYDLVGKVVIALVRVGDAFEGEEIARGHLETWAFDAGKNEWQALKPPREPDGWGNRRRILTTVPDQQVIVLEAYVNPTERVPGADREQQIWTYRYGKAQPEPALRPPAGVRITTKPGAAVLSWQASLGAKGYKVYRGVGELPWAVTFAPVATVPAKQLSYQITGPKPGQLYHYLVRAVDDEDNESEDSVRVRTQPWLVEDVVASVVSAREVRLAWKAPTAEDIVGYHLERAVALVFSEDEILRLKKDTPPLAEPSIGAIKAIGPFVRLTKEPVMDAGYIDKAVDLTKPQAIEGQPIFTHRFRADQLDAQGKPYRYAVYAYRVRAVNALGVEGGPSPYVLTIPSAPEWLFAREDSERCHLKWAANPLEVIKGYRVYRMEGPRINGPGQKVTRLTADPLTEPRYTDPAATKDTKRYWIVAVDALGQEGFPSAPAWHYRQYRKVYESFVSEWHQ